MNVEIMIIVFMFGVFIFSYDGINGGSYCHIILIIKVVMITFLILVIFLA